MKQLKFLFPHVLYILGFAVVSLVYFYPVLEGKVIEQSDITQFSGMSRQITEHRNEYQEEPYWLDNAFGGMPSYQVSTRFSSDFLRALDLSIRFLPRPADYLFLYLFAFYLLMISLKVKKRYAVFGALAFGFSTYLIIILGVGHNTKALAIGYMPMVIAGILMAFRTSHRNWGWLLTAIALGLQIHANHYQMTYYLLLLVLIIGAVLLWDAIQKKTLKSFLKSLSGLFVAALLAAMMNAPLILATQEYTPFSTRGQSELTVLPDGSDTTPSSGLSYDYITEYSYGVLESMNLLIPRFMGGGNSDSFESEGPFVKFLRSIDAESAQQIIQYASLYWGDQPIVAAPAYLGIVVVFFFILALFLYQGSLKKWLIAGAVLSLLLSWGKNFPLLTDTMIDYFPFYNKFRAVSSIQVLLEFCIPVLAVFGMQSFFTKRIDLQQKTKALLSTLGILGCLLAGIALLGNSLFSFTSSNEIFAAYPEIIKPLIEERQEVLRSDTLRSLGFVIAIFVVLGLWIKNVIKERIAFVGIIVLLLIDLVGVNKHYVNANQFVSKRKIEQAFQPTRADRAILNDTTHYRVYEPNLRLSHARTAYFHNAIGGYHAAKPQRFQELYDFHIANNHAQVINMMNIKYIIQPSENNPLGVSKNPNAYGNAWFVNELKAVPDANTELLTLKDTDLRRVALTRNRESQLYHNDSTAQISLASYKPNELIYITHTVHKQLAVFSEVYYPKGWEAFIDDKPASYLKVNYLLRALEIPAGSHTIRFQFRPKVVQIGWWISMSAYLLLFLFGLFQFKKALRV
ncbi:MAG: YfhO family protein [Flavobacteriaceae bacterium]|nr:YfhO family protein [Flavobacteriaceae bacterium]MDG2313883.1 YfhO family protein [Flavobacteriaceae bacterium]